MKKIITLVVCCILGIGSISAYENDSYVTYEFIDNIYSNRKIGEELYTGKQGIVYVNGEIAYCLDPTIVLTNDIYTSSSDFQELNIDDDKLHYIELVSYFGYGYDNRIDSKYYLAVQEIIWEYLTGGEIYWTDGKEGEIINIDSYKDEILNSIYKYNQIPDIPLYSETYQGDDIVLEDKNNVLNYYESDLWLGKVNDNTLTLSAEYKGTTKIKLTRKPLTYKFSYLYLSDGSQTLTTLGYTSNSKYQDTIEVTYKVKATSKITVIKKDLLTNQIIKNNETKIRIYDVNNDCYIKENNSDIITIGKTGIYESSIFFDEGEYIIEEVESPAGYQRLSNPVTFHIYEYNGPNTEFIIYNEPNYYDIEIYKEGEVFKGLEETELGWIGTYDLKPMDNIVYGLYANDYFYDVFTGNTYDKDELIREIKVENGYGIIYGIQYGKYYLKEISYPDEYELGDSIEIEFDNINTTVTYNFTNKLKKGSIIVQKVNNDIPLEGGEFTLSCFNCNSATLKSNKEGYIEVRNIPYGEYYLQEIKAPEGYEIDLQLKIINLNEVEYKYKFNNEKLIPDIIDNPEIPVEEPVDKEDNNYSEEQKEEEIPKYEEENKEDAKENNPIEVPIIDNSNEKDILENEIDNPDTFINNNYKSSLFMIILLYIFIYRLKNHNLHS